MKDGVSGRQYRKGLVRVRNGGAMWKVIGVSVYLFILSVMDVREKKVRVDFLAAGALTVCIFLTYKAIKADESWIGVMSKGLLGAMPGVFLLAVARMTGKAGYGDGIVMLILGAGYGYFAGITLMCVSLFLLSACSIVLLLCRRIRGNTRMPYLPFLTAAYICLQLLV